MQNDGESKVDNAYKLLSSETAPAGPSQNGHWDFKDNPILCGIFVMDHCCATDGVLIRTWSNKDLTYICNMQTEN